MTERDQCLHPMNRRFRDPDGQLWCDDCRDVVDEHDRDELIPADLAPRITQMVIDDLRAAGWTVAPPAKTRAQAYMDGQDVSMMSWEFVVEVPANGSPENRAESRKMVKYEGRD